MMLWWWRVGRWSWSWPTRLDDRNHHNRHPSSDADAIIMPYYPVIIDARGCCGAHDARGIGGGEEWNCEYRRRRPDKPDADLQQARCSSSRLLLLITTSISTSRRSPLPWYRLFLVVGSSAPPHAKRSRFAPQRPPRPLLRCQALSAAARMSLSDLLPRFLRADKVLSLP